MNCPHCNHDRHRVTETRADKSGDRRIRLCRSCGRTFTTIERVAVWFGRSTGWMEVSQDPPAAPEPEPPAPEPAAAPEPKTRRARFMPSEVPQDFGITAEAAPLLLQWWREARRSKWSGRATWTEAAWLSSCRRVGDLPADQQLALCQAGVENGWQALKVDYLDHGRAKVATASGRPMPQHPSMLAALEQWPA